LPAFNLPKPRLDDSKLADIIPREDKQDGAIAEYTEAMGRLANLEKETQDKLVRSLGKGGTGSGGGKGGGVGTGTGDARGSGRGTLDERQKRVLRWNLVFDTRNGEDYRLQLQSLGAILGIPLGVGGDGKMQYAIARDLRPPVRPVPEDILAIKRIFWIDNQPESVANLARALGLPSAPSVIVAFFPKEVEDRMGRLEAQFAQTRGKAVNAIQETRFRIVFNGRNGKYEPVLVDLR
jgi:hypothetical protein